MSGAVSVLLISKEAEEFRDELLPLGAAISIDVAQDATEAMHKAATADVIIAMPHLLTQDLLDAAKQVRWIQLLTSGADSLARLRLDPAIVISTGRGVHGPQMAELVFFFMLSLLRDTEATRARRAARAWHIEAAPLLFEKRAVIIGVGAISEAVALRAKAFGMIVVGVSSTRDEAPGFDQIFPRSALHAALADADFVILLTPLTPETTKLIDRDAFAAMPPRARLINVARGGVVDEQELCAALTEGRIAGAGLDVFEREPLSADSPLWAFGNVIISPHIGGRSDIYARQLGPLLRENLTHWIAGEQPTINVMRRSPAP